MKNFEIRILVHETFTVNIWIPDSFCGRLLISNQTKIWRLNKLSNFQMMGIVEAVWLENISYF
jgi:hypothetical protein